jgi:hypothetical protein
MSSNRDFKRLVTRLGSRARVTASTSSIAATKALLAFGGMT